jgi:hypothetical protein
MNVIVIFIDVNRDCCKQAFELRKNRGKLGIQILFEIDVNDSECRNSLKIERSSCRIKESVMV